MNELKMNKYKIKKKLRKRKWKLKLLPWKLTEINKCYFKITKYKTEKKTK